MDEVVKRGLDVIVDEALTYLAHTAHYGISIDLDAFDPADAPGVGLHEANGLSSQELLASLSKYVDREKLLGIEITEFNPSNDIGMRTEQLICDLLKSIIVCA